MYVNCAWTEMFVSPVLQYDTAGINFDSLRVDYSLPAHPVPELNLDTIPLLSSVCAPRYNDSIE